MIVLAIIGLALCGTTVALATWGVVLPRVRATARLREIDTYGYPDDDPDARPRRSPLLDVATRLGALIARRVGGRYEARVKRVLVEAGLYDVSPRGVIGAQLVSCVLAGGAIALVTSGSAVPTKLVLLILFSAIGWFIPLGVVRERGRLRRTKIERKVPDLIDMLVVTIEAGLGFGASMQAASTRMKGPLGEELRLAMREQDMGSTMRDALFHCAERTKSRSMNSFVRAVTQGEALGVSIGTVMRNIAEEMRVRRRQEAEERAQKAPVKMLFPLIFLMFPALMIVILGPAMTEIFRVLGGM
jgi:tight adherence protein C